MDSEHDHHIEQAARRYIYVFVALLVGTLITVVAAYIPFGSHWLNIVVALFIATAKASLVAGYFMHLISERKLIYGLLGATAFFFAGLMILILSSHGDQLQTPLR